MINILNGLDEFEHAFEDQVQLGDFLPFHHGYLPSSEDLLLEVIGVLH